MIPKFRAWDKELQTMLDVSLIDFKKRVLVGEHWKFGETNFMSFDDIKLMQSTGLFDRNGKEIFEGDIVKTTRFVGRADEVGGFYEYDKGFIGVVKQLEGAWVIDTGSDAVYLWAEIEENEVVGNIYEHLDYLKKRGN